MGGRGSFSSFHPSWGGYITPYTYMRSTHAETPCASRYISGETPLIHRNTLVNCDITRNLILLILLILPSTLYGTSPSPEMGSSNLPGTVRRPFWNCVDISTVRPPRGCPHTLDRV